MYAVLKGREVLRADFRRERIRIAFSPLENRFDVADASTLQDKSCIPDIAVLWAPGASLFEIADDFVEELRSARPGLTNEEARVAKIAIGRLHSLPQYSFSALTLAASVEPETVAEVFVRINGEGKKLNQADFILTLMSVFWDEGRAQLESFAQAATRPGDGAPSPYNHFFKPAPDQMLRVTVGLGLKRARLENVYSVLRGRDAVTGKVDTARRDAQFEVMRVAQDRALNLATWHHFLSALAIAGYRHEGMISSRNAIIYCYVLFLIGLVDHDVPKQEMRQAAAEFFFMAALTGRYTSSPETRFEFDLAHRSVKSGTEYLAVLRQICSTTLTNDFWSATLPTALATSAPRSPSRFAYQATLIRLGARGLFSPLKIADMVDPAVKGSKATFEQHHIFPRGYLKKLGIIDTRQVNQIANFAVVEWPDNAEIRDKPPADYAPPLDAAMNTSDRENMCTWHALPPTWWELPYDVFLRERRIRMADLVRKGYADLCGTVVASDPQPLSVAALLTTGEGVAIEFKSTLRTNLHTGLADDKVQLAVLKSIAGFLNAKGGTLVIGVADDGKVLGLTADAFMSEDKMALHVVNLVRDRIGDVFLPYVHSRFEDQDEGRILIIQCDKGPKSCFVKDGNNQRFYVRGGNATVELLGNSVMDYVKARFT